MTARTHHILNHSKEKYEYDQKYLENLTASSNQNSRKNLKEKYKKDRTKKIEDLILANPAIVGHILKHNPQHAGVLCTAMQNIAADKRNRMIGEAMIYTTVGAGLATASIMTLGGALPLTAIITAATVGIGFFCF